MKLAKYSLCVAISLALSSAYAQKAADTSASVKTTKSPVANVEKTAKTSDDESAKEVDAPAVPSMPQSVAGQCHALVYTPAKLGTKVDDVVLQSAGEKLEVIPAKYNWIEKNIVVTEEQKTLEVVPATYKTIKDKVLVEPERIDYEIIPAKYEEKTEQVLVKPAMKVWKKSAVGALTAAGEVMRSVDEPAQYATVTKKVMITPPQVKEKTIPAVYATVDKKVIDKPATTKEVVIPAEYKKVRVNELVTPAREVRTPIPATYQKITKNELLKNAQMSWQRVPCEADLNANNIKIIQASLRKSGYKVSTDGKFGKGTVDAIEQFQKSKGLSTGAITIETLKALGVNIK